MSAAGQTVLALLRGMAAFFLRSFELLLELLRPRRGVAMLVTVLLVLFLGASFFSTLEGLYQLAETEGGSFNPVSYGVAILVAAAVTAFMWVMLERARLPGPILVRLLCIGLYFAALVWSFSFGYSFWWSKIASRADSTQSINRVVGELGQAIGAANSRVTAISSQLATVAGQSEAMAKQEDEIGGSCRVASGAGRQHLWQARQQVNARILVEVNQIQAGWVADIGGKLAGIKSDRDNILKNADKLTSEERNRRFSEVYENSKAAANDINEATKTSGPATGRRLRDLADQLNQPPGSPKFTCYDPDLAGSLIYIAGQIEKPIDIRIPAWAPIEGRHATTAATARLAGTLLAPLAKSLDLPPGQPRMEGRDWTAFLAAFMIDLAIVALTFIRPRPGGQTFMADVEADHETTHRLSELLRRYSQAAQQLLHDLYFSVGHRQYIALPDAVWKSSEGLDPRGLHLAMAAVANRLSARRCTSPSEALVTHAADRLRLAGWSPPGDTIAHRRSGIRGGLRDMLLGSVHPYHPTIYRIQEADRNEALRLLAEQDLPPPPRRERPGRHPSRYPVERGRGAVLGDEPQLTPPVATAAAVADEPTVATKNTKKKATADPGIVQDLYAAAVGYRSKGDLAEAEKFLAVIRDQLPQMAASGIEVLGLDGVAEQPFDAAAPFLQIAAEPSDLPRGFVLRVEQLAFVQRNGSKRKVLKEGSVVVSAGRVPDDLASDKAV